MPTADKKSFGTWWKEWWEPWLNPHPIQSSDALARISSPEQSTPASVQALQRYQAEPWRSQQGEAGMCGAISVLMYLLHWKDSLLLTLSNLMEDLPITPQQLEHPALQGTVTSSGLIPSMWRSVTWPSEPDHLPRMLHALKRRVKFQQRIELHARHAQLSGSSDENLPFYLTLAIIQLFKYNISFGEWRALSANSFAQMMQSSKMLGDFAMNDRELQRLVNVITGKKAEVIELPRELQFRQLDTWSPNVVKDMLSLAQGSQHSITSAQFVSDNTLVSQKWKESVELLETVCGERTGGCIVNGHCIKVPKNISLANPNEIYEDNLPVQLSSAQTPFFRHNGHYIYIPPGAPNAKGFLGYSWGQYFTFSKTRSILLPGTGETYDFLFLPRSVLQLPIPGDAK